MKHTYQIICALLLTTLPFSSLSAQTQTTEVTASEMQPVAQAVAQSNVFKASVGAGLIYSNVYSTHHIYKRHASFDFDITYQHTWRKGWGIGVNYAFNAANYGAEAIISQNYIGPSVVYAFKGGRNFRADAAMGFGYVQYAERMKIVDYQYHVRKVKGSEGGFGMYWQAGAEYLFTRHFGIGAQISWLTSFYERPENNLVPDDESYGLRRVNLLIGPRVYF